jgi:hypothetical protein
MSDHRFKNLRLVGNIGIERGAPFDRAAIPSRLVVTQRKPFSHCAMMGRHAAPVLHDPGTRTTVGPCPDFIVVDASELVFDHGVGTPLRSGKAGEGCPTRRPANGGPFDSIDGPTAGCADLLTKESA